MLVELRVVQLAPGQRTVVQCTVVSPIDRQFLDR
jgi:hypothetical protein